MRTTISRYLDNTLSRRGFIKSLAASGISLASAKSILASLEHARDDGSLAASEYRSVTGSGGDLLVQQTKEAGIGYVFTNTGSYEVGFFDALIKEPGLQLILGLHEGIVISMADGYHRITREPAFVNVHVIAGTAQMAGQLYNAHKDDSSLIVTAGLLDNEVFSDDVALSPAPGFDQKDINRQFTKISWEVRKPESIPVFTRRAFKVAAAQPGGPVYVAYTNYALEAKNISGRIVPKENFIIPSEIKASPELIDKTARYLAEAENPILVCGDEIWKSGAWEQAIELAELMAIPASSSREAFRNFPTRHPLYIGRYSPGMNVLDRPVDLAVCLGTKGFGRDAITSVESGTTVVRCGLNTANIGRDYPFDLAVVGNVKEIAADLIVSIKSQLTASRIQALKTTRLAQIQSQTQKQQENSSRTAKNNCADD